MDRTVTVWGQPHAVSVAQKAHGGWVAEGKYKSESLFGYGPTASAAMTAWTNTAKAKGPLARA